MLAPAAANSSFDRNSHLSLVSFYFILLGQNIIVDDGYVL